MLHPLIFFFYSLQVHPVSAAVLYISLQFTILEKTDDSNGRSGSAGLRRHPHQDIFLYFLCSKNMKNNSFS